MTITQTVEIPPSRRLTLDVPREVPVGTSAHCEIRWFPRKEAANNLDATLERIRELCKDAPITVDSFLEMHRQEGELEEKRFRRYFPEAGDGA